MGIGKNVQNEKTEPKQGKSLFWVTRRRTVVRQVAMFFYSKKKILIKKKSKFRDFFFIILSLYLFLRSGLF